MMIYMKLRELLRKLRMTFLMVQVMLMIPLKNLVKLLMQIRGLLIPLEKLPQVRPRKTMSTHSISLSFLNTLTMNISLSFQSTHIVSI
jgi:hypothetical protein